MEYRSFTITQKEGQFSYTVHDQFGNWYDSFVSIEHAKTDIDEYGHEWHVCPECHADPAYVDFYDGWGYECSKCHAKFLSPLYLMV